MQKTTSEIEPYIDRSYYDSTLRSLRAQNNPALLIGFRNPYTGKVIRTESEADLYLQQQALSTMYRSAANTALSKLRTESESRIHALEGRVADLEKKRRRPLLAVLLICAAFFLGSQSAEPSRSAQSASTSYTAPIVTSAPRPAATSRPASTPKPKATATPKSTTYKTKPKKGYDLERTVYVSRTGKIHLRSNCSGMKNSDPMTYAEACERGYVHCQNCF